MDNATDEITYSALVNAVIVNTSKTPENRTAKPTSRQPDERTRQPARQRPKAKERQTLATPPGRQTWRRSRRSPLKVEGGLIFGLRGGRASTLVPGWTCRVGQRGTAGDFAVQTRTGRP